VFVEKIIDSENYNFLHKNLWKQSYILFYHYPWFYRYFP